MSITNFRAGDRPAAQPGSGSAKVTVQTILDKKNSPTPFACLTAYDYSTARLVDESGMDIILVGDSLGMVVLGYDSTLPVTMDEMLHHTRAVRRAVRRALLVADMPFGSYHASIPEAVGNAARFLKEAGAEAVKIEGGANRVDLVRALGDAEIPVVGHIGLTPQSLHKMGGYKVQGKTLVAFDALVADAKALEAAGCFAIVLEGVPSAARRLHHVPDFDSDDWHWRRPALRRAGHGLPRSGEPQLFAAGEIRSPLRRCRLAFSRSHHPLLRRRRAA